MKHQALPSQGADRDRFVAIVKPLIARPLAHARSWDQLHERLGDMGLILTRYDGPLRIGNGEISVRFDRVSSAVDLAQLERRFGHWHAAIPLYHPKPGRWDDVVRLHGLGRGLAAKTVEATRETARELTQLVDRIGWSTAARILPVAQFQAVRITVGLTHQALSKILDPDLGRDR